MSYAEQSGTVKRFPFPELNESSYRIVPLGRSETNNAKEETRGVSSALPSPPPVSPHSQVPLLGRKARNTERRKHATVLSPPLPTPPLRGPVRPSFEPSYFPNVTVHEDSAYPWTATTATSAHSDGVSPSQTSKSKRSSDVSEVSSEATPDLIKDERYIPVPARTTYKWRRETSGLSFEVQTGKKSRSGTPEDDESSILPFVRHSTTDNLIGDDEEHDESKVHSASPPTPGSDVGRPRSLRSATISTMDDDAEEQSEDLKEGLYCRTKRALGLKHGPVAKSKHDQNVPERSTTSGTGVVLDKVASQLRDFKSRGREETISDTASNLSIAAPNAMNRWHLLQSLYSSSTNSSTSSLRSFARGRPRLVNTPDPLSMYTGSDMKRYLAVELTSPKAPTFLPSEAHRIETPGTRDFTHYFDSPSETAPQTPMSIDSTNTMTSLLRFESSIGSTTPFLPKPDKDLQNLLGLSREKSNPDYYRVGLQGVKADESQNPEDFVLSVPEHLPNSPMCPRHPKNKSKGKGVCVYHGRNVP